MNGTGFALGLPGTFRASVDCFNYVRVSKKLGVDYTNATIKLEILRLRYTRWAEAVNLLSGSDQEVKTHICSLLKHPDQEYDQVANLVGNIKFTMEDAMEASHRFERRIGAKAEIADTPEDPCLHNLASRFAKISIERQKGAGVSAKLQWALFKKGEFYDLIGSLRDDIDNLYVLFPGVDTQALAKSELETATDENEIDALGKFLNEDAQNPETTVVDNELVEATHKVAKERGLSTAIANVKDIIMEEGSEFHIGKTVSDGYKGVVHQTDTKVTAINVRGGKGSSITFGDRFGSGGRR